MIFLRLILWSNTILDSYSNSVTRKTKRYLGFNHYYTNWCYVTKIWTNQLYEDSRHQFRFIHEIVTTQWIHFLLQHFLPCAKLSSIWCISSHPSTICLIMMQPTFLLQHLQFIKEKKYHVTPGTDCKIFEIFHHS